MINMCVFNKMRASCPHNHGVRFAFIGFRERDFRQEFHIFCSLFTAFPPYRKRIDLNKIRIGWNGEFQISV